MPDVGVSIWGSALKQIGGGGGGNGGSAATYLFATTSNGRILRVTIADGTTTQVTSGLGSGIRGLAVDAASEHIYICDRTNDKVVRVNFDGSGVTDRFTDGGGTTLRDPYDCDLDKTNSILYIGDDFSIRQVSLDGTTDSFGTHSFGVGYDAGRNELVSRNRSSPQVIRVYALPGATTTDYANNAVNGFAGPRYLEENDDYLYANTTGALGVVDRQTGTRTAPLDGTDWGHSEFGIDFESMCVDEVGRRIYCYDDNNKEIKVINFSYEAVTTETISVPDLRAIAVDNRNE